MPSVRIRWRDALVACPGALGTDGADRTDFYFEAANLASLNRAFHTIARRVMQVRRVN